MYFKEIQRFRQWWLWLLLTGISILPFAGVVQQIGMGIPFGSKPASNAGLIIVSVVMLLLIYFFYSARLITEIDDTGIRVKFTPFVSRNLRWDDIESAKVIDYGFVGGWGIRYGSPYGTVYNMSGRIGLWIKKKDGSSFVVGTQQGETLEALIHN